MKKKKILKLTLASLITLSTFSPFCASSKNSINLEKIAFESINKTEETVQIPQTDKINLPNLTKGIYDSKELYSLIDKVYNEFPTLPEYLNQEFIREAVRIESTDNSKAISKKGARGLMQLTYSAWNEVEKELDYYPNVFDPQANLRAGLKYLLWINDYCESRHPEWSNLSNEDKRRTIMASYNGGASRLSNRGWEIERMYGETRDYITKIEKGMGQ